MRERESYRELILENIEYDYLIKNRQLDRDRLDELVELMVDTVCSRRETIRIAGDDYPAEVVKSRCRKLDSSHIEYVLDLSLIHICPGQGLFPTGVHPFAVSALVPL